MRKCVCSLKDLTYLIEVQLGFDLMLYACEEGGGGSVAGGAVGLCEMREGIEEGGQLLGRESGEGGFRPVGGIKVGEEVGVDV